MDKNIIIFFLCMLPIFLESCKQDSSINEPTETKALTLEEIYYLGITNNINKEIIISSKVKWYNSKNIWNTSDTLYASQICLNFETGDRFVREDLRGQERGNMFIYSKDLKIVVGDSLRQIYIFKESLLDTITSYLMIGKFNYRSWLNVDSTMLSDSTFIMQSNDVTYWSQTFQFDLQNIMELSN